MKTLLKLLIAAAVIHAAARAGGVAWQYYQLKDASEQIARFAGDATEGELQGRVLEKAADIGVPLEPHGVVVARDGQRTRIEAAWQQPVELLPSYTRVTPLSFSVDTFVARPTTLRDLK